VFIPFIGVKHLSDNSLVASKAFKLYRFA